MKLDYETYLKGGVKTITNIATGNIPGAIVSGIGATMGLFGGSNSAEKAARMQYENNLKLQKQAQQWDEYMYKNRYQMQRQDLEKAGINALYGLGNAPSVTSATNSVGMPEMVSEQNNKVTQLLGLLQTGQALSSARTEQKYTEQKTATEIINTQMTKLKMYEQMYNNEMKKIDTKYYEKQKVLDIKEQIERTKNIIASTESTLLDNAPKKRYEEIIKKNPQIGRLMENLDRTSVTGKAFMNILKSGGTGLKLLLDKR